MKVEDLVMADGKVYPRSDPGKAISFRAAARKLQTEDIAARARRREEYKTPDGKSIGGALGGVQFAEVAVVIERDGERCRRASIVLGAAAPIPRRAREAEAALAGQVIDEEMAGAAARAALADASPMTQNGYKVPLFEAVIRRTILAAISAKGGPA